MTTFRISVCALLAGILFTLQPVAAQQQGRTISIPPIPAPAQSHNPPCGSSDFGPAAEKIAQLASKATNGAISEEELLDAVIKTSIVRSGASNCGFYARVVGPNDPVWFIMNGEAHPYNCNGFRTEILVNYGGASHVYSVPAGDKYIIYTTFKNWSNTNTFTGRIITDKVSWPTKYCKNAPSSNTASKAPR